MEMGLINESLLTGGWWTSLSFSSGVMEMDGGIRNEEIRLMKDASCWGWNLQAGGPEEHHRCTGGKRRGCTRIGLAGDSRRGDQSVRRKRMRRRWACDWTIWCNIFIRTSCQHVFSCIFCPCLRIHTRVCDIKKSVFTANRSTFAGEPRAACWVAFTGLEEGVHQTSGCVCEAARGQI